MKIPHIQEIQKLASNNSSGVDFKDFMNLYKECCRKNIKTNHDTWW